MNEIELTLEEEKSLLEADIGNLCHDFEERTGFLVGVIRAAWRTEIDHREKDKRKQVQHELVVKSILRPSPFVREGELRVLRRSHS